MRIKLQRLVSVIFTSKWQLVSKRIGLYVTTLYGLQHALIMLVKTLYNTHIYVTYVHGFSLGGPLATQLSQHAVC